jgi:5-methylcytosine-specific restriction endonuclease McrA
MSENTECPECRKMYSSEKGMKIHRTKSHGEWREYDCPTCQKSLETYKGLKTHHYHKHDESISGERVQCSYCGDELSRRRNVVEKQDNFFCDAGNCQSKWNKELDKEDHGSWNGGKVDLICDWCDKRFKRKQSEAEKYDKSFCSNNCRFEWKRENHPTGEDNWSWNEGCVEDYGSNWNKKREETIHRDEYKCQVCGMTRDEHHEQYGRDLSVHHKIPIAEFDEPEDANYLINLVTTCRSCHGKLDTISRREADRKPTISV